MSYRLRCHFVYRQTVLLPRAVCGCLFVPSFCLFRYSTAVTAADLNPASPWRCRRRKSRFVLIASLCYQATRNLRLRRLPRCFDACLNDTTHSNGSPTLVTLWCSAFVSRRYCGEWKKTCSVFESWNRQTHDTEKLPVRPGSSVWLRFNLGCDLGLQGFTVSAYN